MLVDSDRLLRQVHRLAPPQHRRLLAVPRAAPAGKLLKYASPCTGADDACPIMHRALSDGTHAVLFINGDDEAENALAVTWKDLGVDEEEKLAVRDVLQRRELGTFAGAYKTPSLSSHASQLITLRRAG